MGKPYSEWTEEQKARHRARNARYNRTHPEKAKQWKDAYNKRAKEADVARRLRLEDHDRAVTLALRALAKRRKFYE